MNTLFLSSFFLSSLQCVVCLNCTFQQPLSPVTHLWCSPTRIFWIDTGGFSSVHFSSVAQLCLTLCDPMDCNTPGFLVRHEFSELAQTHVHCVGDAIQPSHPLLSPSCPAFNLSQHQGLFQSVSFSHQVGKVSELQHQSFQYSFRTDFL